MTVNIHEAKTQFSRLIERVAAGETVVIARAGRPIAKLTSVDAPPTQQRLGFLAGQASIPDDFNERARDDIAQLFEAAE